MPGPVSFSVVCFFLQLFSRYSPGNIAFGWVTSSGAAASQPLRIIIINRTKKAALSLFKKPEYILHSLSRVWWGGDRGGESWKLAQEKKKVLSVSLPRASPGTCLKQTILFVLELAEEDELEQRTDSSNYVEDQIIMIYFLAESTTDMRMSISIFESLYFEEFFLIQQSASSHLQKKSLKFLSVFSETKSNAQRYWFSIF